MKAEGERMKAESKIPNPKSKIQNWVVAVSLLWGVGCGYQFAGKGEGFPKDVKTVFVETLVN